MELAEDETEVAARHSKVDSCHLSNMFYKITVGFKDTYEYNVSVSFFKIK